MSLLITTENNLDLAEILEIYLMLSNMTSVITTTYYNMNATSSKDDAPPYNKSVSTGKYASIVSAASNKQDQIGQKRIVFKGNIRQAEQKVLILQYFKF